MLALEAAEGCRHQTVWDLQELLKPGDLLVVTTPGCKARLQARRPTGGAVELLVLEPVGGSDWLCLAKPASVSSRARSSSWSIPAKRPSLEIVAVDAETVVRSCGFRRHHTETSRPCCALRRIPLPPYIHQRSSDDDSRYQTRCLEARGGGGATAGLHLSDELLDALEARGVQRTTVTLHVGLGTFRPVETEDLAQLELHSEWVEVSAACVEAVAQCRARGGRVIAVGTTSVPAWRRSPSSMAACSNPMPVR